MNRPAALLFVGLLALGFVRATDARAADGWSSFEGAFPLFPCQDGWTGCMVGGQHVDAELRKDEAGRAIPSDARIGWFDLKATPMFSPFVGLSDYAVGGEEVEVASADAAPAAEEEEEADGAAAVDEEPAEKAVPVSAPTASGKRVDDAAAAAEEARTAKLTAQREQKEAEAKRREADVSAQQKKEREDKARKDAALALKMATDVNAAAAADERDRLNKEAAAAQLNATEMERQRKIADAEAKSQREAELAAQQKATAEAARQKVADQNRLAAEEADREEKAKIAKLQAAEALAQQTKAAEALRLAQEKEAAKPPAADGTKVVPPATGAALPTVADGDCADTSKLEPISLLGKLTEGTMQCLETRLVNAPKMTDKKKISGLLMTDAWAKGDKERWETLIKRHLDEIDQSDPDLCYKYALHLSRQGPGRASGVIRWANVALENRTVWIGDTYTSRVYSLYKVRAAASQSLWQQAETEHAATPGDETRDKVEKYRNMTKVNAREWFEYAKSSGKDSSTALQLCMSAAGTADYCEAN